MLAILACYACLRHSDLCASQPGRCLAVLRHAALLVGALLLVDAARLAADDELHHGGWVQMALGSMGAGGGDHGPVGEWCC